MNNIIFKIRAFSSGSNLMGSLTDFNYWWPQLVFLPFMTIVHSWIVLPIGVSLPSLEKKICKVCIFQFPNQVTIYLCGTTSSRDLCPGSDFWLSSCLLSHTQRLQLSKREPAYWSAASKCIFKHFFSYHVFYNYIFELWL